VQMCIYSVCWLKNFFIWWFWQFLKSYILYVVPMTSYNLICLWNSNFEHFLANFSHTSSKWLWVWFLYIFIIWFVYRFLRTHTSYSVKRIRFRKTSCLQRHFFVIT
jgi:hypothetical protein